MKSMTRIVTVSAAVLAVAGLGTAAALAAHGGGGTGGGSGGSGSQGPAIDPPRPSGAFTLTLSDDRPGPASKPITYTLTCGPNGGLAVETPHHAARFASTTWWRSSACSSITSSMIVKPASSIRRRFVRLS